MDNYNVGFNWSHLTAFTWNTTIFFLYPSPAFIFKAAHKAATASVTRGLSVCCAPRLGKQILLHWHNKVFKPGVAEKGTSHTVRISCCICVLETQGSLFTLLRFSSVLLFKKYQISTFEPQEIQTGHENSVQLLPRPVLLKLEVPWELGFLQYCWKINV